MGKNVGLPLCVCGVCTLHNSGNLFSSILRIKQVNLAFPLFAHIWCLEAFENPILSHQLISFTQKNTTTVFCCLVDYFIIVFLKCFFFFT